MSTFPSRNGTSRLVAVLLVLLALSGGVAGAQTETTPDGAKSITISSNAVPISVEFAVREIGDPGRLWLDGDGLHLRDLAGISAVSGDITGAATTATRIGWAEPCHPETLICRGAQTSFQELTITDEAGEWTGELQLVIHPTLGAGNVAAILVGRGGNAGQALYLNQVTKRTDVSLSMAGYRIASTRPIGGVNLTNDVCLQDAMTASGGFLSSYAVDDSGPVQLTLTRGIDAGLGMTVAAQFEGQQGSLIGVALERETTAGGSAGRFVLLGGDGDYTGYLGFGRTGSQLVESDRCSGGYALHSFWIGEVYLGSSSR